MQGRKEIYYRINENGSVTEILEFQLFENGPDMINAAMSLIHPSIHFDWFYGFLSVIVALIT